jgi:hypothetical protein
MTIQINVNDNTVSIADAMAYEIFIDNLPEARSVLVDRGPEKYAEQVEALAEYAYAMADLFLRARERYLLLPEEDETEE